MRRLLLTVLVATAGCSSVAQPQHDESLGSTGQAVTLTSTTDDDDSGKDARPRWVTPHGAGSTGSGGGGGVSDGGVSGPSWQPLTNWPNFYAGVSLLLTDGSVMVQDMNSSDWWKLTPDTTGSYVNGTWTQLASLPGGYQPLYFASAVLPDGRVVVEGGEYQAFNPAWQTTGAIYDPQKDTWTTIAPPDGWTTIGDAQSAVLADGSFYLANCCTTDAAVLNPKTLTWTAFGGKGKADVNDEEGWTLLANGDLLTVDANNTADLQLSELFTPRTATWTGAGDTRVQLADIAADDSGSHEMGPQMLRPDGTVLAIGATGHNAVYDTRSGRWSKAADFPNVAGQGQLDTADGPAVLFPNGHVLVTASPDVYETPLHMFDFDGASMTEVAVPPQAPYDSSYNTSFLLLPNGQVLFTDFSNDIEIYTPQGKASCGWEPQIDESCGLSTLRPGTTYSLSGTQLNGLSQAVAYGDDEQAATNYPLVRVTYRASGHVSYLRTHDHSSMGIGQGAHSSTSFDVPAGQEAGEAELVVVANGIPSAPITVRIK